MATLWERGVVPHNEAMSTQREEWISKGVCILAWLVREVSQGWASSGDCTMTCSLGGLRGCWARWSSELHFENAILRLISWN